MYLHIYMITKYIYLCVYVYVNKCVCECVCVCMYVCICVCEYIYIYICACVSVCMCMCVCKCVYAHASARVCVLHRHVGLCTYIHISELAFAYKTINTWRCFMFFAVISWCGLEDVERCLVHYFDSCSGCYSDKELRLLDYVTSASVHCTCKRTRFMY